MVVLSSCIPPTDGVRHVQINTGAHVQNQDLGPGTLYIAESQISWLASSGQGFCLAYPEVSLHAVSRDLTAFPHECLYLMVDAKLDDPGAGGDANNSEEEGDADSTGNISEVRFIPEDKESLEILFRNMSDCQALHPDPDDSFSDDEFYEDAEDAENLTEEGRARLERLENVFRTGNDGPPVDIEPQIGAQAHELNHVNGDAGDVDNEPMETGQFEDAD